MSRIWTSCITIEIKSFVVLFYFLGHFSSQSFIILPLLAEEVAGEQLWNSVNCS